LKIANFLNLPTENPDGPILSPFGSRVHAPWTMAVAARLHGETAGDVDVM